MYLALILCSLSFITTAFSASSNISSQHASGNSKSSNNPIIHKSQLFSPPISNSINEKNILGQEKLITKTKPLLSSPKNNKIDAKVGDSASKKKIEYDPKLHGPNKAFRLGSKQGTFKNPDGSFNFKKYEIGMASLAVKHKDMEVRQVAHSSKNQNKRPNKRQQTPIIPFYFNTDACYETDIATHFLVGKSQLPVQFGFDMNSPLTMLSGNVCAAVLADETHSSKNFHDTVLKDWQVGGIAQMSNIVGQVVYDVKLAVPYSTAKGTRKILAGTMILLLAGDQWASIGLAPTAGNDHHPAMWIETFYKSFLPYPISAWAMWIGASAEKEAQDLYTAEIMLGGSDPSKYVGEIVKFQVAPFRDQLTDTILWNLRGHTVAVNGEVTHRLMGTVNFDINHDMINLDARLVLEIYKLISGHVLPSESNPLYSYPCDSKIIIGFNIWMAKSTLYLHPDDFNHSAAPNQPGYCIGAIQNTNPQAPIATFGLPFFSSFYTYYQEDLKGNAAFVGIAVAIRPPT